MKINKLFDEKNAVFSFEVFPPKKNSNNINNIYNVLDELAPLNPDFISVTYGAGGNGGNNATCELARYIKDKLKIEPLAHLTCINSTQEAVKNTLDELKENNIENILALRGDKQNDIEKIEFKYATDLIDYTKKSYNFNISAACYPESHPESINSKVDIDILKEKVEKGATHFISQLFFDNNDFYNFMYQVRNAGITVPIQAGIMPVVNRKSIERIVSLCGATLPKKFVKILRKYENNPEALFDASICYATEQIIDLLTNDVSGIHLYTMNNINVAKRIKYNVDNVLSHINLS